jgi:hypothetical protein
MRRLIVVVGVDGRQGSSVVEALLEYQDEWLIRGTTTDMISMHSQVFCFERVLSIIFNSENYREKYKLSFRTVFLL